jgi:hypothetical protein
MKKCTVDRYIKTGKQHLICEDYAVVGDLDENTSYLIVSDGCSSGTETDVDARLLCILARNSIKAFIKVINESTYEEAYDHIRNSLSRSMYILGTYIKKQDLLATLMIAIINKEDNTAKVFLYGDGSIITEHVNGDIKLNTWEYENNTPPYLCYYNDSENLNKYISTMGATPVTHIYKSRNELNDPPGFYTIYEDILPLLTEPFIYNLNELKSISLCSDGINSFYEGATMNVVDSMEICLQIIDNLNKNRVGKCIQRSCKVLFQKFEKDKINHNDDFSIASFIIRE